MSKLWADWILCKISPGAQDGGAFNSRGFAASDAAVVSTGRSASKWDMENVGKNPIFVINPDVSDPNCCDQPR